MLLNRILLPFNLGQSGDPLASVAFSLAKRFGAELECLFPQPPLTWGVSYPNEALPPSAVEELLERARRTAEAAREQAQAHYEAWRVTYPGVESHFRAAEGHINDIVAHRARIADLTVFAPATSEKEAAFWRFVRDGALLSSGRPSLLVPPASAHEGLGQTVVIGWNDSIEVARAIAAARPFLTTAKRVRLVSVGGDDDTREGLADVKAVLERGRPAVETDIIASKGSVVETLMAETEKAEGGLLVIGAYSHWRWREWPSAASRSTCCRTRASPS